MYTKLNDPFNTIDPSLQSKREKEANRKSLWTKWISIQMKEQIQWKVEKPLSPWTKATVFIA